MSRARRLVQAAGPSADAYALLERAAVLDNPEALYALGTWHLFGTHVRKNLATAANYLIRAADLGHPSACFDLAVSYEKGMGVDRDRSKAFSLYMNASLLGDRQATYEVGRCFYWGIGTTKDRQAAAVWFAAYERTPERMAASVKARVRPA